MKPIGLIICGGLLLAYIVGMKWLLRDIFNEHGFLAGAVACVTLFLACFFIARRVDARDRKNGRL